jgi:hypothetical protein
MSAELKKERQKAHAKMRDELRIAVKEKFLTDFITRGDIRREIQAIMRDEVLESLKGADMREIIRQEIRAELTRMCGGNYVANTVKEFIKLEAQRFAAKVIEDSVIVKVVEPPEGAW